MRPDLVNYLYTFNLFHYDEHLSGESERESVDRYFYEIFDVLLV